MVNMFAYKASKQPNDLRDKFIIIINDDDGSVGYLLVYTYRDRSK